ncbi:hypothetical protein ACFLUG_01210 [Chloroflexota bacterium]
MRERIRYLFSSRDFHIPQLSRFLGVRVRLHYTWLLAVVSITAAVVTQFSTDYPLWQRVSLGAVASVLFFFGILFREFILNIVAVNKGISVKRVTLFAIGGIREVELESNSPSLELLLAVSGLLLNLMIAGFFLILYTVFARSGAIVVHVLIQWLAYMFFMVSLFHFVPGFPLDAGRLLRALLWKLSGNYELMTFISSWVGWTIGLILVIWGIYLMANFQEWFSGILFISVGLILQNAATHSRKNLADAGW